MRTSHTSGDRLVTRRSSWTAETQNRPLSGYPCVSQCQQIDQLSPLDQSDNCGASRDGVNSLKLKLKKLHVIFETGCFGQLNGFQNKTEGCMLVYDKKK